MANSKKFLRLCVLTCIILSSVKTRSDRRSRRIKLFNLSHNAEDVKFYYYPYFGERREVKINDVHSLAEAGLLDKASTVIIIDGFLSVSSSQFHIKATQAYRDQHKRQNVFTVDYSKLSGSQVIQSQNVGTQIFGAILFQKVLGQADDVGLRVAEFMEFLHYHGVLDYSNTHIIGMSLGAHIAGSAGTFTQVKQNVKVGRITGLDPAFTFFPFRQIQRLRKNDAYFVDIYHTNKGGLGEGLDNTGDINVYINNGQNQPGCSWQYITHFTAFCSHSYAWRLYVASFIRELKACPCFGLECRCRKNCKVDKCAHPISVMSQLHDTTARGTYRVSIDDPLSYLKE